MAFFLILGMVLSLTGLFFLCMALRGRNPANLVETVGALTRRQHFRDLQIKSRKVKNLTDYTYSYTVGDRTYKLTGTLWTHPRKLMRKTTVVYLKDFPRLAYIEEFTGIREWLLGGSFLAAGLLYLWISTRIV